MNIEKYLKYPAQFISDGAGYAVTVKNDGTSEYVFSELPTCGDDWDDAMSMATDVVITMAESLIKEKQTVPGAAEFQKEDIVVKIPYHVALKIMLRNLMLEERYRPADICKKLDWTSQEFNAAMSLRKKTAIDTLASIYEAVGRPLQISC